KAGYRVEFVRNARVRGEMPASLRSARSQNMRWEAGRLATIRDQALPLLKQGVASRSITMIDAAVEQLVPPLSVPTALACFLLIAGLLTGSWVVWPAAASITLVALYIAVGLFLAGVGPHVYRALLHAPLYVGWKFLLYGRALIGPRE